MKQKLFKKTIFDLEADNLLDDLTKMYVIALKVDDNEVKAYTNIEEAIDILRKSETIIGHNIISYDIRAIKKLYKVDLYEACKVIDTLKISQLLNPDMYSIDMKKYFKKLSKEPKLYGSHSLKAWGIRLGEYKGEYNDWSKLTPEMIEYCKQDVVVTAKLYDMFCSIGLPPEKTIEIEQDFQRIINRQEDYGVYFNVSKAEDLYLELMKDYDKALKDLREIFKPLLLPKGAMRTPKTKPAYQPMELTEFNPASGKHIVSFINHYFGKQEWSLTEKGNPKTSSDILEEMFKGKEFAKPLFHYLEVNKVLGQLADGDKAWLKVVTKDNRIHGKVNTIGAVTRRCTHNNPNLAQVPSSSAFKGKECRELFCVPKGKKLVGVDAEGLELRMLSHYLYPYDKGVYARAILTGDKSKGTDIHTINQMNAKLPTRDDAKTFIYGFLYGAGNEKIGQIIGGTAEDGAKLKARFLSQTPALKQLGEDVVNVYIKRGYLKGLDGFQLYPRQKHSALNTLLQGGGAWVMKVFTVLLDKKLSQKYITGKDYEFVLNVHDENQLEVNEDIAEDIAKIAKDIFKDVTEYCNLRLQLEGEAKIGNNWSETH